MLRLAPLLVAAALTVASAAGAAPNPPSQARGVPWSGSLVHGVQLPAGGSAYVTWDPVRKHTPNRGWRRWGTDRLVHTVLRVLGAYARAYPWAPPVVVGDLSRPHGGDFGARFGWPGHASHQNGLDVDVYYPRRDRRPRPPVRPAQIDHRLAQALVTRFVRAGASHVFVGPHTGLRGPRRIVSVLPAFHDNHMHVRLRARPCTRRVVNGIHGYRLAVPCGWAASVGPDGSLRITARGTQVRVFASGRVPGGRPLPGNRHVRLGAPGSFEGVGSARTTTFALRGRVFQAVVHPAPAGRQPRAPARHGRPAQRPAHSARLPGGERAPPARPRPQPSMAARCGRGASATRAHGGACSWSAACTATSAPAQPSRRASSNNGLPLAGELVVVQQLNPDGFAGGAAGTAAAST